MQSPALTVQPRVGVGVLIRKNGLVLFGQRHSPHGKGDWCCPGGHLELGEDWASCARREVWEECGLEITPPTFGWVTNDMFTDGRHYITITMLADYISGEPVVCEPDKISDWRWCAWHDLPQPLFLPIQNALAAGHDPFAAQHKDAA